MRLPNYDWSRLESVAEEEVERCWAELPEEIASAARRVPCLYRRWHPNAPVVDPEAVYMLGEYLEHGEGPMDQSGVIALYFGAIAWYCDDEDLDFREEIRRTYLHELGHHFGWGEGEIAERGLA